MPSYLYYLRAALTDTFYSSGMCLGRLTSTFLSTLILPSKLVIISMAGCILSTILLMFLAPLYYISLYIGVFVSGFFLSWQFASAFSWTSYHMNITGKLSSIFFIGNNNFILFLHPKYNVFCVEAWVWAAFPPHLWPDGCSC